MDSPTLYRGLWPRNVSKTAKYSLRNVGGTLKVTVMYDLGDGLEFLAVENDASEIAEKIGSIKRTVSGERAGVFYVNEFGHLLVAASSNDGAHYYFAGKMEVDFRFNFEGTVLTTRPVNEQGQPLTPGDRWTGPRPGIPYVLAASGNDIYFRTPALTESDPPEVRERVIRRVQLSKVLRDRSAVARAVKPIADIRGSSGGRFYVNEHQAIFTPVEPHGDGDGIHYIYCGQVELSDWFPEPSIP